ncbi:MAG: HlyD family efflux transporter periplasmic adaptor subunit [Clostridia bacterium]|nr:HlyD family efflux transporter periplasmic adaptor subunit [Clostridia bacterium]
MGKRAVLGLVGAGLAGMILVAGCCSPTEPAYKGVVETNIYGHYSEVGGKIIELPVEPGQEVRKGEVIAVLDDTNERYVLAQLEKTLAKKQALLAELTLGLDPEELKQGQNNVALAELAYENAQLTRDKIKQDYEDALALWKAGALAQAQLDQLKYQADLAEAAVETAAMQLDNARQKLALLQKGLPKEKIAGAQADVELTQIQIRQSRNNLAKYTITALCDGTVVNKNYLPGSIVSPGYNLIDIASATEKHLVIYVPKEYLPHLSYGQEVGILSGEQEYKGTVSFIDVKAQYTPKDLQTQANKNKESVKVRVSFSPKIPLKVGEKAEVIFRQ